ncbi:hypothetical protein ACO1ZG_22995 [Enterobacter kobei]|uniref:hypothetical protein n=1 Tax=Enterobacter kobei TaxID=208224 RepID=UPI003BF6F243
MGSCAAPSAKGDDKFITTDYLQQCRIFHVQVGGGATTGVVSAVNNNSSSWMRAKLAAYRNNPVKLKD